VGAERVVRRHWTKHLTTADSRSGGSDTGRQLLALAEWKGVPMLDGVWWTIEGLNGGTYHSAGGSLPDEGPVLELGARRARRAAKRSPRGSPRETDPLPSCTVVSILPRGAYRNAHQDSVLSRRSPSLTGRAANHRSAARLRILQPGGFSLGFWRLRNP